MLVKGAPGDRFARYDTRLIHPRRNIIVTDQDAWILPMNIHLYAYYTIVTHIRAYKV